MQIAEILSDLTSLRVCDPSAALALVSARSSLPASSKAADVAQPQNNDDTDLERAKNLVELHYSVKMAHSAGGPDRGLLEAREAVKKAVGLR